MNQEEYIKKWLDGTLSEVDQRMFEKTEYYAFLSKLDRSLQQFKAPDYDQPLSGLQSSAEPIVRSISWSHQAMRIAASVIFVMGTIAAYFYLTEVDEVRIDSSYQSEVYLPDSSLVKLNAASLISYNEDDWGTSRKVSLNGEAYFDVRSASQFEVVTPAGKVSVLGTKFNVQSREGYFEVSCFQGSVRVEHRGQKVILEKNESWRALKNTTELKTQPKQSGPDWMSGESHFENVPFKLVLKEFERQYNVKVKTKNIDIKKLYTGSFANDNINLAVKSISIPLNLRFSIEEDQVVLSGDQ